MITNERQYKITRSELQKLEQAVLELEDGRHDPIAFVSLDALRSEIQVLQSQVAEYEYLRSGAPSAFVVCSLSDLPRDLIRARIAKGLSQRELAQSLGLKEQQIQRYEASQYSGASVARLLDIAADLGLEVSAGETPGDTGPHTLDAEVDWARFPVKEMYKRHWFGDFSGSLDAAIRNADELVAHYIQRFSSRPALALHRKHVRAGSAVDEYALLAWECRVLDLALQINIDTPYSEALLTDVWIEELVGLSVYKDGPVRAIGKLAEVGIPLIIEPHLPGTHLDGAALLWDDMPVIGMTLRYDRIDNFWFVLLHELVHAIRHLKKGRLTGTFDDLDSAGSDNLEDEADLLAGNALIPEDEWELAVARYVRTPESVISLGADMGRNPAIIAGRVRHEANNYIILADLVGSGRLRRQFPEVEFSV